jgi:DNA-directed RNA polymerase III subunit RPC3
MADKEAVRLAEHIVRSDFGAIVASVASVLMHRGRMRLPEIAHFTKLSRRSVAGILMTLIQHNLAWHSTTDAGGRPQEFFEMNLKECLMRLRWARILELTHENMGDDVSVTGLSVRDSITNLEHLNRLGRLYKSSSQEASCGYLIFCKE